MANNFDLLGQWEKGRLPEINSAKEARAKLQECLRKSPRLSASLQRSRRIMVRSKWRSSSMYGDNIGQILIGNYLLGDNRQFDGKTYWT